MKKIYQLKSVLDLILWLSIVLLAISIAAIVISVFIPTDLDFSIRGRRVDHIDLPLGLVIGFSVLGYAFFMLGLLKMQKLVTRFVAKEFFTAHSVALLNRTGLYLLISAFLLYIPPYLYDVFASNKLNIELGSVSPESFFFLIIIALFFITLSYIFEEAKILKEENEYTV